MLEKNTFTFLGFDNSYEESSLVIFGAPFDGTASYRAGSRFAPSAMRAASFSIETYSPYLDRDLEDVRVFDGGDIEFPFGNTEKVLSMIEEFSDKILSDEKLPLMIGGEHLVTLGAVRSMVKKYPDLCILHFDAHTDLRDDYLGEKLSHGTVMRRCHELVGNNRIFQFGIRSGERDEFLWAKKHTRLCKFGFSALSEGVREIGKRPVYLSIDLDVLDPSEMPGTGTPEAGGVSFLQVLDALGEVRGLNIVGADINELSPEHDTSGISTSLACKLLRELVLNIC